MEKTRKSIIAIFAITALLAGTLLVSVFKAKAIDPVSTSTLTPTSSINPTASPILTPITTPTIAPSNDNESEHRGGKDENEQDKEKQDIEEQDQEESDLHEHVDAIKSLKDSITLEEVDDNQLSTYADIVTILKSYQGALAQIKSASDLQTGLVVSLNDKEKALLEKLLAKHSGDFGNLDARISELNGQIQELIDLLVPLADQPISSSLRIKKLLISEIKGLREQINNLIELENLNVDEVDEEIS